MGGKGGWVGKGGGDREMVEGRGKGRTPSFYSSTTFFAGYHESSEAQYFADQTGVFEISIVHDLQDHQNWVMRQVRIGGRGRRGKGRKGQERRDRWGQEREREGEERRGGREQENPVSCVLFFFLAR